MYNPRFAFEMRISEPTVTMHNTSGYDTIVVSNLVRNAAGNYTIAFPLHPTGTNSNLIPVVTTSTGADIGSYYHAARKFITATSIESKVTVCNINTATTLVLVDGDLFFRTVP